MLYFTMLLFVKEGKESVFNEFEELSLSLLQDHKGKLLYRIRPDTSAHILKPEKEPYEVHVLTFESESDFIGFVADKRRASFLHLKNDSIESSILIKGKVV